MSRAIGFLDFPKGWEGPISLPFKLVAVHTKTVRYQSPLENRMFDLYLPSYMLPGNTGAPSEIVVAVGKAAGPLKSIGLMGDSRPLTVSPEISEFEFDEPKQNSMRYVLVHEGQRYYLYVPAEVFATEVYPPRLFLMIAVPQETTN